MADVPHDIPGLQDFNRVAAVAAYLTVSQDTIYRAVAMGRIGCVRVGTGRGGIRIRRDDVAAFVAANTHEVKA